MDPTSLFSSYGFRQWVAEFLIVFFLVGGVALLVIGLGLVFNSARTLRVFASLNHWVSMRPPLRPFEIPRDTQTVVRKWRFLLAAAFIAGGAFALYGLVMRYDAGAIVYGLKLGFLRPSFSHWVMDSVRWVLIVGNVAGIAVGIMLAFFPDTLASFEARGSRWYSERRHARNRDAMHITVIDQWVAEFPRASGLVIAVFAVFLIGAFGLMLPALK